MEDGKFDQDAFRQGLSAGKDLGSFVSELTRVSHEFGLGIADRPTIYILESDDYNFSYRCDGDGKLVLR